MVRIGKVKKLVYIIVLLIAVMIAVFWSSGLFGLWFHGMAFLANNTKQFTEKGHPVDGAYSLQVDLSSLESNIGKEIFNDGIHRIYVSWLQKTQNGGYDVGFRSSGSYSLSGATLISGIHHETLNDHSFTMSTTAQLTAAYDGNLYNGQATGQCGLNYKDGDCFSFSLFMNNVEHPGIVKLTITDLYQNSWRKK